jgi:hypothetical protein
LTWRGIVIAPRNRDYARVLLRGPAAHRLLERHGGEKRGDMSCGRTNRIDLFERHLPQHRGRRCPSIIVVAAVPFVPALHTLRDRPWRHIVERVEIRFAARPAGFG